LRVFYNQLFTLRSIIVKFVLNNNELTAYSELSDQELAALLRQGDTAAFAQIYHQFKARLYLHALRTLKDPDDATDLVQEVFTNLWDKRESFTIKSSIGNYLYGAVRNRVFNHIAHQTITTQYAQSIQSFLASGEMITDNLIREKELAAIIEREINSLPEKMRQVFLISRNTDLSHKEIGKQLGISDKTVKKQVGNAVRILRLKINLLVLFSFFF
jgi:RNA polymerase sigma-70 factor (family 1)